MGKVTWTCISKINATLPKMQSIDRLVTSLLALFAAKTGLLQRPYMDSSSFASKLCLAIMARLHTYIRPHKLAFIH